MPIPVNSPMGTNMMSTMRGSTMSSLMSLSSQVRQSTAQFTCIGRQIADVHVRFGAEGSGAGMHSLYRGMEQDSSA